MRWIRTFIILFFILAAAVFGVSRVQEFRERDETIPVITSDREILEIPCDYTQDQLLKGLTAYDEKDGDLTDEIVAGNFSRFLSPGLCNVTYVVFDSSDQPGTLTRQVRFSDYHSPEFTLSEPLVFEEGRGSYSVVMERLGAQDLLDGDLSEWIVQTDTDANYQRAGEYHIQAEVENSYGDTSSVSLPVHVVKSGSQSVRIGLTSWILYLEQGGAVNPADYIGEVSGADGSRIDAGQVTWESSVDTQTPGVYEIHYTVSDGRGQTGETWMTVVVREQEVAQ